MNPEARLLRRVRFWTGFFIFGLLVSGVTALPLRLEVDWLSGLFGADSTNALQVWLQKVRLALNTTEREFPFLFYGTDWLAFGHFTIALAFVGAWRDPVRNQWLFTFGLMACALVIPYALVFGAIRGIPWWWRLVDASFGVVGAIPLWYCRRWTAELEGGVAKDPR